MDNDTGGYADEYGPRRPHRPQVTLEAVMLALIVGARCPHKLAALFDVDLRHPALIDHITVLMSSGALRVAREHDGFELVDGRW